MSILRLESASLTSTLSAVSVVAALLLLSTFPAAAIELIETVEDSYFESGGNVTLGEMKMYYEIHGEGEPLLLIMGLGGHILDWG